MVTRNFRAVVISILTLSLFPLTFAQSIPPKRKKIKDFGSSLKRLKWNPQANATAELTPANGQGEEVEEGWMDRGTRPGDETRDHRPRTIHASRDHGGQAEQVDQRDDVES